MSYTKFHLTKQKKNILVCNQTGKIINEDGSPLFLPNEVDYVDFSEERKQFSSRKKSNSPVRIRIILGQACNYSCTYCSQKDIGNPNERNKNENLFNFITEFDSKIDRTNLKRVELWGGEPFLYWEDMIHLMNFFDNENISFGISTNGSTLMEKHIEFFNSLKGTVDMTISHDGPGQLRLRGDEIFDKPRVKKVVKMVDDSWPKINYSFNSVITNTNYNLFEINSFFKNVVDELELKHTFVGFEIGRTYDSQLPEDTHYSYSYDNVIHGENLEKFSEILKVYYEEQYEQHKYCFDNSIDISSELDLIPCGNFIDNNYTSSVLGYLKFTSLGFFPLQTTNCGVDWEHAIDMDLNGNVRTCQNVDESHIYGNINNIKGIRILSLDINRKNREHCSKCPVKLLCKSSCPIKLPEKSFLRNCDVEKVWYTGHLIASLNILFDDEVTIIED